MPQEAQTIPKGASLGTPIPPGATLGDEKPPRKWMMGREFGMDVARGLGFDPQPIALAEETGGTWPALKEMGSQFGRGVGKFGLSVLKDPFNISKVVEGPVENLERSGSIGEFLGGLAAIGGGALAGGKPFERPSLASIPRGPFSRVSQGPGPYWGPASVPKPSAPSPFPLGADVVPPTATSAQTPIGSAELPPVPKGAPTPFPSMQPKSSLAVSPQPEPQWFPEPRAETPIDRPGSMWSVGRETLPSRAGRGQPGALDVLTNIGDRPPLVTPKPSIGVPDPSFQALQGRQSFFNLEGGYQPSQVVNASETASQAPLGGLPQGSSTPFEGPPSNLAKVWSDKLRDPTLSEYERSTLLDQWKGMMGYDWRPR